MKVQRENAAKQEAAGKRRGGVVEEGERGKSGRVEILRLCEGGNGINPEQGEWTMREKEG